MSKSYREQTVSDLESSKDDPTDKEYHNTIPESDDPTSQDSSEAFEIHPAPVTSHTAPSHTNLHSKVPAHKRKAPTSEVVDLTEAATPSPKRVALEIPRTIMDPPKPSLSLQNQGATGRPRQEPPTNASELDSSEQSFHTPSAHNAFPMSQPQEPKSTFQGQLDDLGYLVYSLVQARVEANKPLTPDMMQRLRSIQTSMQ